MKSAFPLPNARSVGRLFGDCGSAAVELALATPILLTLACGMIDFSSYLSTAQALAGATRVGAEYARNSANCTVGSGITLSTNTITAACQNGIQNAMTNWTGWNAPLTFPKADSSSLNGVSLRCYCDNAGTMTPAAPSYYLCNSASVNSCPSGQVTAAFVLVNASEVMTPIISWESFPSVTLSGWAELRVQ